MLYDLNVPWSSSTSDVDLQRIISFLSELNYTTIALNHAITTAIPAKIINPIPETPTFSVPSKVTLLRRCTLTLSEPAHNHRLPALAAAYDILSLRPVGEKAFLAACTTLSEFSLISLDLSIRHPYHFRPKQCMAAVNRGVRFEISYAQGVYGTGTNDSSAKRNFISNVLGLVRATSGRGLVISSEAKSVLGIRAPADVMNLLAIWGLGQERAAAAMNLAPRSVVVNEAIRRSGYRGIVDILDERFAEPETKTIQPSRKHKLSSSTDVGKDTKGQKDNQQRLNIEEEPKISKRQAKRMKLEAMRNVQGVGTPSLDPGSEEAGPTTSSVMK